MEQEEKKCSFDSVPESTVEELTLSGALKEGYSLSDKDGRGAW